MHSIHFYEKINRKTCKRSGKRQKILAVIIFGSYARKEKYSDIDICIVLDDINPAQYSKKRLDYLAKFPALDIHIFQQLPIYIKIRVLKEGKVIHCKNDDKLYDIAIRTMKMFELYKPIYNTYLEGVLHAR